MMKRIFLYPIYGFISSMCILLLSVSTSPLHGNTGPDSPIFMLIGKSLIEGKQLYVDLFDHKGPVIFIINAIGMALPGTWGMFLVESLFLFISLIILYKITNLVLHKEYNWVMPLLYVFFYACTMREGNSVNAYANLFVLITLYYMIRYLCKSEGTHPPLYAYIYGICFGIIAFLRVSNALCIVGIVLAITLLLWKEKKYKEIAWNALGLIAGIASVAVPMILWFLLQGTLYEMIYATFLFNIDYAKGKGYFQLADFIRGSIVPLCILLLIYINPRTKAIYGLRFCMSMAVMGAMVTIHMGVGYQNYNMAEIPLLAIAWIMLGALEPNKKRNLADYECLPFVQLLFVLVIITYPFNSLLFVTYYPTSRYASPPYLIGEDLAIPETEKDEVLALNIDSYFYLANDIMPPYYYFCNQYWWTTTNTKIYDEIQTYLSSEDAPKWIVIQKEDASKDTLISKYDNVQELNGVLVWKHK